MPANEKNNDIVKYHSILFSGSLFVECVPALGQVLNSRISEINLVCFHESVVSNNTYWIVISTKKKDIRIVLTLEVKGKTMSETLRVREYSNMFLYTARKAWMTSRIWSYELKRLDRELGKEKRRKFC